MKTLSKTFYLTFFVGLSLSFHGCSLGSRPSIGGNFVSRVESLGKRWDYSAARRGQRIADRLDQVSDNHETIPELEAALDMRLRQRFELGEPLSLIHI